MGMRNTGIKVMNRKFFLFQKELILDGVSTHREECRGYVRFERKQSQILAHALKSEYVKYADLEGQWRTEFVSKDLKFPSNMLLSECVHETTVSLYGGEEGFDRKCMRAEEH
jgi:hypothetical protein